MAIDLDEIKPNHFIVRNDKVHPFLRGEGSQDGTEFMLETWRRDGWLYRLQEAGFNVRTLEGRVAALPAIRHDLLFGPNVFRPLATAKEQWAAFDGERLRWHDLPVRDERGVRGIWLRTDEPVRRRKSRSGGDFFVIVPQRDGGAGLLAVTEDDALLHAYGLLANSNHPPTLRFTTEDDRYRVQGDGIVLPPRHATTLDVLSETKERWTFGQATAQLAEAVFEMLGMGLVQTEN